MPRTTVELPYRWRPRPYQRPFWQAFVHQGYKRCVLVHHRRAGKDLTCLNATIIQMVRRVGTYFHILPFYSQARKAIWDGRDGSGRRFLDYFPPALVAARNEAEMKITLKNGSIWQLVGSDNVDSLLSANPVGLVFSEYSLQDPKAWDYLRPIISENGGWAVFAYTPRGRHNHGYTLYRMAQGNPEWFCQLLTVEDTGAIPLEAIEEERRAGMSEQLIEQEFYCSFAAANEGSIYGPLLDQAYAAGRIGRVPHDASLPVHTAWDLGFSDLTSIWFFQAAGQEIHLIDFYEAFNQPLAHYARVLDERRREHGYLYGVHYAPHDIEQHELSTGQTRRQTAADLGIPFTPVPRHPLADGIEAVRQALPRMWFDAARCEAGLAHLENYRREYSEKLKAFKDRPLHDLHSHAADALRTGVMGLRLCGPGERFTREDILRLEALYRKPF